jgi:hypothetical protein
MGSVWIILGIVVATVLCVAGLVAVGFIVIFCVGLQNWANNK